MWGGRDEAISKLKGAGATHALPRSYLHVSILLCASFHMNYLCSTYSTAVMDYSISTLHSGLHFARIHGFPLNTVDQYVTLHEPYLLFRLDRG